ncbi:MAG: GNAT family N-acetyltransferase [Alphaproteobacteria bacterium]|nr:GNAT family N-acetyltransferase [Alphaproteobacteria bacterium]
MSGGFSTRTAKPSDRDLIFALIRELAAYERLLDEVDATANDIERDLFGPSPRVFCDIAEAGGKPAGFALWFYNYSTFRGRHGIYLEDLFVRPEFRGQGIGKALLVNLAKRAVAENCSRVEWSVLDWNEPSIAFYKSLGAKPMDEWTIFRLSDAALRNLAARE